MKYFAVGITSLVTLAAASPIENIQQDLNGGSAAPSPGPLSQCAQCAQYCDDPSNGSGLGAACYVVKCGIKCLIG